jgi:hypothetical protein
MGVDDELDDELAMIPGAKEEKGGVECCTLGSSGGSEWEALAKVCTWGGGEGGRARTGGRLSVRCGWPLGVSSMKLASSMAFAMDDVNSRGGPYRLSLSAASFTGGSMGARAWASKWEAGLKEVSGGGVVLTTCWMKVVISPSRSQISH